MENLKIVLVCVDIIFFAILIAGNIYYWYCRNHRVKLGSQWISVKEQLPPEETDVLYTNGEFICLGSWGVEEGDSDHSYETHVYWCDEYGNNEYEMDEVTHWMPLPQIIKGDLQ